MKILLIGQTGQIGRALAARLGDLGDVIAPGRESLDLTDHEPMRRYVERHKPDVIINAAGYTRVDEAETRQQLAFTINGDGPAVLADCASTVGAVLIHYSTDYVFDGPQRRPWKPDDRAQPANVYGASKRAGERAIIDSGCDHVIIRTSWVYDTVGSNFVNTILGLAARTDTIRVVNDQIGSPTWSCTVADATVAMLQHDAFQRCVTRSENIFHVAASGQTTWYDFAVKIFDMAQVADAVTLEPVSTEAYGAAADRPRYSVLDCGDTCRTFDLVLPAWEDSLAASFAARTSVTEGHS